MPVVELCGHSVLDRTGAPSTEQMETLREVSPNIIYRGLVEDPNFGIKKFRNYILNHESFGAKYNSVITEMYQHGSKVYNEVMRQPGMPFLKESPEDHIPPMDSF